MQTDSTIKTFVFLVMIIINPKVENQNFKRLCATIIKLFFNLNSFKINVAIAICKFFICAFSCFYAPKR